KILASVVPENLVSQIKLDIHRQFPNHLIFANLNGTGQRALFNVLKAYCSMRPETGYCQAHAPIASAMLIHMPEEEAFWTFLSICDQYMQNYFNPDLIRVKIELKLFMSLLKKYRPEISKHLAIHTVEPIYFATDWFMCLLTRNLPWATVLRILDMFFFEGIKVIFRTALAILDLLLGARQSREKLNSMDSIMNALRRLPSEITTEEILIPRVCSYLACKQFVVLE
ncbi:putative tbc1 domain family member, partial [Fasciolopsis buskii]